MSRGLDRDLALKVATQLMEKDALGAHARDELGILEATAARPVQAALASALPLLASILVSRDSVVWSVALASLLALAILGGLGARVGGAAAGPAILRIVFWGAAALAVTAGVGAMFGTVV